MDPTTGLVMWMAAPAAAAAVTMRVLRVGSADGARGCIKLL